MGVRLDGCPATAARPAPLVILRRVRLTAFLTLAACAAAPAQQALSAEQAHLLGLARVAAMGYSASLPTFICDESVQREEVVASRYATSDKLTIELTFDRAEKYKLVAINGHRTEESLASIGGLVSGGEFGSLMLRIFEPSSAADFEWKAWSTLRNHRAAVFTYRVPRARSHYLVGFVNDSGHLLSGAAGYRGEVTLDADAEPGRVLRLTAEAYDFPGRLRIVRSTMMVDYDFVDISGHEFSLPVRAESHLEREDRDSHNLVKFIHYRKFEVESTLAFGTAKSRLDRFAPLPRPATVTAAGAIPEPPVLPPPPSIATAAPVEFPPFIVPYVPAGPPGVVSPKPGDDTLTPPSITGESPALFRTRVNLVSVPVVVRDTNGHDFGTFTKDSFLVFDNRKPQQIVEFSVEQTGDRVARNAGSRSPGPTPVDLPERFIAYLFDDLHLPFGDLARARDAVGRQLAKIPTTERAAIYTTSGQNTLDFTDDLEKLQATLLLLRSRSMQPAGNNSACPYISEYMADLIVRHNDRQAINLAAREQQSCDGTTAQGARMPFQVAALMIQGLAQQVAGVGDQTTSVTLSAMKDVVHRVGMAPGQRIVVLVSNGFLATLNSREKNEILDQAIRANVTINALEARGLWTDPQFDENTPRAVNTDYATLLRQYDHDGAYADGEVLTEFTAGSGGSFFHGSNDLDLGVRQAAAAPEFRYVLAFSPQNLKLNGSFHALKVALKAGARHGMEIQARKGYYAAAKLPDAEENAKQEMSEVLFSRDELSELPVELQASFVKSGEKNTTLTVVCRLDPKQIRGHKAGGRSINSIRVLTGLFDRNGSLVSAMLKEYDIQAKDETITSRIAGGKIALSTNFSVPPGSYIIRMVVMDAESGQISALNGAVAIQ